MYYKNMLKIIKFCQRYMYNVGKFDYLFIKNFIL